MKMREHVPLREVSWFKTGGATEYYVTVQTLSELLQAIDQAMALHVPYRIIGLGANSLMSDSGFPGMIIQNLASSLVFIHDRSQIMIDSGLPVQQLLNKTVAIGYSGLEFLAGLHGTLGGAIVGDASAYGFRLSDYVKSATILIPGQGKSLQDSIKRVDRGWFEFEATTNKLRQLVNQPANDFPPVLLSVTLQLSKMTPSSSFQRMNDYLRVQKQIQPATPSSLQLFSNLRITGQSYPPDVLTHRKNQAVPLIFVDKPTIRTWSRNRIAIYPENPNYVSNQGLGFSKDVDALIRQIRASVATDSKPLDPLIDFIGLWE